MPNEGVRTVWLPLSPEKKLVTPIVKNEGYINIHLVSAQYRSEGTWWQKRMGGTDAIALTTGITYRAGNERIEAKAVQQRPSLKADTTRNLAINKVLAEKIPATADALSIEVQLSVLQNDRLREIFEMLQRPEYQPALELTPKIVGQVLTISSMIKQLLTEDGSVAAMQCSYSGIIPAETPVDPLSGSYLSQGWLLFIDTGNDAQLSDGGSETFEIKDMQLFQRGKKVERTYLIFRITADSRRGVDQSSHWNKKYTKALQHLDAIRLKKKEEEQQRLLQEAMGYWMEGNVLLETDQNYVDRERIQIVERMVDELEKKYVALGGKIGLSREKYYPERWG